MQKIILLFFVFVTLLINAQSIFIYGGKNNDVFLGCLNCSKYDKNSIWNAYSNYGSKYSSKSIWNKYGSYGGSYSSYSPFNEYTSDSPVLVDKNGNFYGYFTANKYKNQRTTNKLALLITKYWEKIGDDVSEAYDEIFK